MKHDKKCLAAEGICYQGAVSQGREAVGEGRRNHLKEERQSTTCFMKPLFDVIFAELCEVFSPLKLEEKTLILLLAFDSQIWRIFSQGREERCTQKGWDPKTTAFLIPCSQTSLP